MVKRVAADDREYDFCVRLFGHECNRYLRFHAIAAVCTRDAERQPDA